MLDLVVLGRQGVAKRDNAAVMASLERHWNRLQKQCNAS